MALYQYHGGGEVSTQMQKNLGERAVRLRFKDRIRQDG
ncbi:MAG: hypothetical protein OJF52_004325 [Nitrospira sp.]|nr:MAG: hypothetical protein OJF52_004325 [Nitrospira sp.]